MRSSYNAEKGCSPLASPTAANSTIENKVFRLPKGNNNPGSLKINPRDSCGSNFDS